MASRALLRRRSYDVVKSLSEHLPTVQCFSSIERQGQRGYRDFKDVKKKESSVLMEGFYRSRLLQSPSFSNGVGILELPYPLGYRLVFQSMYSSLATANKPDHDKKGEKVTSQTKEASPEECDEAVEGLSLAKAKAKAMKLEESQKSDISIMQRVRLFLLGIGPALRAIASMSRLGCSFCCFSV